MSNFSFLIYVCVHADFLSPSFSMSFFVLRKKTCTSFAKKTANQWKRRIVRDHFFYVIVNIDHYFNLAIISLNKQKLLIKKKYRYFKKQYTNFCLVCFSCLLLLLFKSTIKIIKNIFQKIRFPVFWFCWFLLSSQKMGLFCILSFQSYTRCKAIFLEILFFSPTPLSPSQYNLRTYLKKTWKNKQKC